MNTTLFTKFFFILSFLSLSDAWLWRREPVPIKRGNLAGKGPEQGSPAGPLKEIMGEIDELHQDVAALTGRVDELENKFEELVLATEEQEDESENPESTADPSALGQGNQVAELSDETAVRALLQRLESRLNEKKVNRNRHYPEELQQIIPDDTNIIMKDRSLPAKIQLNRN